MFQVKVAHGEGTVKNIYVVHECGDVDEANAVAARQPEEHGGWYVDVWVEEAMTEKKVVLVHSPGETCQECRADWYRYSDTEEGPGWSGGCPTGGCPNQLRGDDQRLPRRDKGETCS